MDSALGTFHSDKQPENLCSNILYIYRLWANHWLREWLLGNLINQWVWTESQMYTPAKALVRSWSVKTWALEVWHVMSKASIRRLKLTPINVETINECPTPCLVGMQVNCPCVLFIWWHYIHTSALWFHTSTCIMKIRSVISTFMITLMRWVWTSLRCYALFGFIIWTGSTLTYLSGRS